MKRTFITITASLLMTITLSAQNSPLWLRRNDISPDGSKIAFTYKGNIYTVPVTGGKAVQLTTNPEYDSDPMWTPDGKNIVFSSYREKSKDIYKVSAEGGTPVRLTSHSQNETPLEVMKDGSVLYTANIQQDAQYGDFPGNVQLYMVGPEGGKPVQVTSLPVSNISVNEGADGIKVIYEDYKGYEDALRKHHTSSVTRDIWMYTPGSSDKGFKITGNGTFTKLSTFKGEDRNPVFKPGTDTYYYISEEDGTLNIYASSLASTAKPKQLTFFKGNPVRYISVSNDGTICFSYDGELYTMKEGSQPSKVNISIVTDQVERLVQDRTISSGARSMAVSPNGKEVAVILRGDVYVTTTDHSTAKRITNTAQQERDLSFSKDGKTLYYSAERNGHWGIWKTELTDKDDKYFTYAVKMQESLVTKAGETCFQPQVSPDGKSIAYLKDRTAIAVMDLKSGKEKIVLDRNVNYSYQDGDQHFSWSPDSRYILCNYQANGGWNNEDVALIDVESGEITDLTESGYTDGNFKWALGGKAMTWASDKNGYRSHGSWGAEDDIYIMFFDGKSYMEFQRDKEDRTIADLMKDDKEEKK